MKAALALLADFEVSNFVRKLAWESHQHYRTSLSVCRLPPHISLKQPFGITDLPGLESYMGRQAASIEPFELRLTELQLIPINIEGSDTAILWIDVRESETLRHLHLRVNRELEQHFGHTQAEFDGADYHFHLTVIIGGQPFDVYRQLYDALPQRQVDLTCHASQLAMFVYDEPIDFEHDYMTYKVLPLG